jgi:hypothetical protein
MGNIFQWLVQLKSSHKAVATKMFLLEYDNSLGCWTVRLHGDELVINS